MSWEKKTIGELCQIEKGKIGIQKAIPGEYPLVVTAEERLSHNEYHFEGNSVVIPLVSSTGHGHRSLKRIHYQSGKFAVGNILCAVIPNDENVLRADYLYRFLDLNREKELVRRMRGMANVTLPMKEIAQIEIPLPPIDAQIKFVQQYSNLEEKSNDLGEELTLQLDLVKQLRQAFLREAMQGKLVPQDGNDEPASVLLGNIKAEKERLIKEKKIKKQKPLQPITEDEIPFEILENWVWCRLGEIFNFIDYRGKTPTRTQEGVRLISAKNIRFGYIDDNPVEYIAENQYSKWMVRGFPRNGDILFVTEGHTMGFVAQINLEFKYVLAQRTICLQPHSYDYPNCIFYFLMSPDLQNVVQQNATGAAATGIKSSKLQELIIPLPPLSEQQRIVSKLDELMQYCDELEASIKESQRQNELLLQQVLREALEPVSAKSFADRPKKKEVEQV